MWHGKDTGSRRRQRTRNLSKAHKTHDSLSSSFSHIVLVYLQPFCRTSPLTCAPSSRKSQFSTLAQISRVNCADMAGNRPGKSTNRNYFKAVARIVSFAQITCFDFSMPFRFWRATAMLSSRHSYRQGLGCYWSLIGSRILAFRRHKNHWP